MSLSDDIRAEIVTSVQPNVSVQFTDMYGKHSPSFLASNPYNVLVIDGEFIRLSGIMTDGFDTLCLRDETINDNFHATP